MCLNREGIAEAVNIEAMYQINEFKNSDGMPEVKIITCRDDVYYFPASLDGFMRTIKDLQEN